ncbi:nucleotidyltransferase family protein [Stenotrophomonas sp. HITSZ_GD]|uniref:nucleotidyltransferase family protein n=1 Tax=Stenotrophomonas sp. HITSZ_GD TaxID=3037248 RepID=UPI00240D3E0B|nr:nucleotidyltransferase family protein [Stenotrophomonas sp. HITSZ_GD]MDG2523782.1 nucleotidyltransferase family protein [Stenotrophomonas sp. HITSZ_GD]
MSADFVAVVLAAGGSRRLGRPKQLLRREGETLLRRSVRLARASGAARVLVALGAQAARFRAELSGMAADVVEIADWPQGLGASLAGVQAALGEPGVRRVLVLGCDQPALDLPHLIALLAEAEANEAQGAFSAYTGVRGLPAVVAAQDWRAARFGGDEGLRALARDPARRFGQVVAPDLAWDIDTPADLAAAVSLGWLDSPD